MVSYYVTADKAKPVGAERTSVHEAITKAFPRLIAGKQLFWCSWSGNTELFYREEN